MYNSNVRMTGKNRLCNFPFSVYSDLLEWSIFTKETMTSDRFTFSKRKISKNKTGI